MARHQNRHQNKERAHYEDRRHAGGAHEQEGDGESERMQMGQEVGEEMRQGTRQFAAMGEQTFEAWMRNSNEALRRVLEVNMELATWSREQLDDSLNAMRSLSQCRNISDAYGVQLGLMRSSMEKSLRHASNVFNLATHAMVGGAQRAQRAGSAAMDEMRSTQGD